ncbi:hypothetical protein [Xanthobacter versatilis]|uniref:hypothetical protein n=1 Tax=Xanthobacter autotrophicus (strain ATCC BAA-1158 / Py2) TaxID=78245 RepID=UPI0037286258
MTTLMRQLIERLEALPDAEQDALAREFLSVLEGEVYVLTPSRRRRCARRWRTASPTRAHRKSRPSSRASADEDRFPRAGPAASA